MEYFQEYIMNPVTEDSGNVIDDTFSLKTIMLKQSDFVNKTILLQHNSQELNKLRGIDATVVRSPKYHSEVTGQGVEHCIAHAKIYIRSITWQKRKNIRVFEECIRKAFSRTERPKINDRRSITFSLRAQDYIVAHCNLHGYANRDSNSAASELLQQTITLNEVNTVPESDNRVNIALNDESKSGGKMKVKLNNTILDARFTIVLFQ